LNPYAFHISLLDLLFVVTISIGLTFALQLWFTKRVNQTANRFLALALVSVVLWIAWAFGIDIQLNYYFPRWSWLPLQFSLAIGPLVYFYVLKITRPEYKFHWKDLRHFGPLLLQQGVFALLIKESISTGTATYDTLIFQKINPVLLVAAFFSVITYLYSSFMLIERFYQHLKFNDEQDRYRHELRWLHRLLAGLGIAWLLWIPFTAAHYYYHLDSHVYYSLYLVLAAMMIWIAAAAFSKAEVAAQVPVPVTSKPMTPAALKQKGAWLKKTVKAGLYYLDPDLSLNSLAEKLEMGPHELSRIINTGLKKSFTDFINEYRVADFVRKMQDPAYGHITLLGIAFESGFNSKNTFNRAFRQFTGKNPGEYKNELKKEGPSYNMGRYPLSATAISYQETTNGWFLRKLTSPGTKHLR
jgi:AraC-like DNA-binding protein